MKASPRMSVTASAPIRRSIPTSSILRTAIRSRPTFQDLYREFEETNSAGYLRFDIKAHNDLLIVAGFRWEQREIDGIAYDRALPRSQVATTDLKYDEVYPSISAKYTPSWRSLSCCVVASARPVGHPDYADLIGTVTLAERPDRYQWRDHRSPNPALKPYFTNNYDLLRRVL
ncbi:MAG: TonB-dependent receptor [Nibricoccus sp.]